MKLEPLNSRWMQDYRVESKIRMHETTVGSPNMPSTVMNLLDAVGLRLKDSVSWGTAVKTTESGVYLVSLSHDPCKNEGSMWNPPIDPVSIERWLTRVPALEIDGVKCAHPDILRDRLASFWLSDENVIYIGKATSLRGRVGGYYRTPLGDPKPHAGGHWAKTLANLAETRVYFAECESPKETEQRMIEQFVAGVSDETRNRLFDRTRPFPFANLECPPGNRKGHGIGRCTVPR